MKLFFCPLCQDIQKIQLKKRKCSCGKSWASRKNDLDATIGGKAIPIGIANGSLCDALEGRPERGQGSTFTAFVIPKNAPSVEDKGTGSTLLFRGQKTRRIELIQKTLEQISAAPDKRTRRLEKAVQYEEQKKDLATPGLSNSLNKLIELDAL